MSLFFFFFFLAIHALRSRELYPWAPWASKDSNILLYTAPCTSHLLSTPRLLSAVAIPLQAPWPPAVPQTHQIQSCLTVCPIYMDTFFVSLKSLLISYQFMRGTLPLESSPALHFFSLLCSMFHLLTCSIVHTFIIAVMYTIPSSPLCHSLPPPYVSFFSFS